MQVEIKDIGKLLKITFAAWVKKDPFRESAIIAYYGLFFWKRCSKRKYY
jgi:membrane protein